MREPADGNFASATGAAYPFVMSADQEKLLQEAMRLPPEARAALAAKLIDSLDTEVDPDAENAWASEIAARLREIDSGSARLVPWAEARKSILDGSSGR